MQQAAELAAPTPQFTIAIRSMAIDDHGYVRATWREGMKDSPAYDRMPWPMYKQSAGAQVAGLVDSAKLVGAYVPDGRIVGWLCMTPGQTIHTVHWVHTRWTLDDEKCRRRGIMTALLDAADLGRRFVYTHRGPRRRHAEIKHGSSRGMSIDSMLVEWLGQSGVVATHIPFAEWSK